MSEAKESALYLHNLYEQEQQLREEEVLKEAKIAEEAQNKYDELRYKPIKIQEAYNEFKLCVRNLCLQYVIEGMMSEALHKTLNDRDQNMVHGLVENFVKSNGGASAILSRVANKTMLLDTIKEEVEETSEEIIAKVDPKDPTTFVVDKKDIEKMMDKLNDEDDFEEVKSAIAIRVVGAEDSFVDNCKAERDKTSELIANTEDKCKAVDADEDMSDEVKEKIKQEAQHELRRNLNKILESHSPYVFDEMVRQLSRSSLKKQTPAFMLESGKVDQERVVNTVKAVYTLIEALSTSKLYPVDEEFLNQTIAEL